MKKFLIALLSLLSAVLMWGCQKDINPDTSDVSAPPEVEPNRVAYSEMLHVGIEEDNGSNVSLRSPAEFRYDDEGNLIVVRLTDPAILSFCIPDKYIDGMGIVDGVKVTEAIQTLEVLLNENALDLKSVQMIESVIYILESIPVMYDTFT